MKYRNGNAVVTLDLRDGTRIIEYPDNEQLTLETPLNIDIRVSTQCPYGYDAITKQSTCVFCHESALVKGQECHYGILQQVLIDAKLPRGTEIALGVNEVTPDLIQFVKNLWKLGLIVNITMNERYITEFGDTLGEVFKHPFYEQIKEWLFELGINISENSYESGYEQGYIDHQSYGIIKESLSKTREDLITYLFNDGLVIYIENDNNDYEVI
jgi:hypothetical protein